MLKDAQCSLHTVYLLSLLKNSLSTLVTFTMYIALRNLPEAFRSSWNIQFPWCQSVHRVRTFWITNLLLVGLICRSEQVNLFSVLGSMYGAVLFIGVNNSSTVQPVVAIERTIFYRERAAGMYSALPYAIALVWIFVHYWFTSSSIILLCWCLVQDDTLQEWPYGGMFSFGFVGIDRTSILLGSRSYVLVDYIFNDKPQVDSCKVLLLHFHHVLQPPLLHLLWYDGCCPHAKPPDCCNCRLGFLLHLQPLLGFSHF